jgi:hypothetical protein
LKAIVERVSKALPKIQKKLRFQALAFTGSSGAAVAYPVSVLTGIKLIHVRAKGTKSHGNIVESCETHIERYAILDDFIDMGNTVRYVHNNIDKQARRGWYGDSSIECVGILLYKPDQRCDPYDINKTPIPVFRI